MRASHCSQQIRLAVEVQPNGPAESCRKPGDTAPSFGFDALFACLSVDGRLVSGDCQYSSEYMPGSRIGFNTWCREL